MTVDEAFAGISHAFPSKAEWQGQHFGYAAKSGHVLIETKKSSFEVRSTCPCCGLTRGTKESRFFYWLLVDGQLKLVHASLDSRLKPLRTIGDSIPPLSL